MCCIADCLALLLTNCVLHGKLACELAGNHYKKIGDNKSALGFFNQAKQCYTEWGSQMKVEVINKQLLLLQSPDCKGCP